MTRRCRFRAVRRFRVLTATAVVALLVLAGCSAGPKPDPTAAAFLRAWSTGNLKAAAQQTDNPTAAQQGLTAAASQLDAVSATFRPGAVTSSGNQTTAAFTARWTLRGFATPWTYTGKLAMVKVNGAWKVHWQPSDIHPALSAGARFAVQRSLPTRAPLLDRNGKPLVTDIPTVTVGIEPKLVTNLASLAATLASVLKVNAAQVTAAVQKAKPTEFVPVTTLRQTAYEAVKPQIYNLPGTVFQTGMQVSTPTPGFAQPLLGTVGQPTADVLKAVGPDYLAGDPVGLSGLQLGLNRQLAGTASGEVDVVSTTGGQQKTQRVGQITGTAGTPVKLTLDARAQAIADSVLAHVTLPAAIVAIQPSTGDILAVANSPASPFDIAMEGEYPAGSTFKIVTATSALANGLISATSQVDCVGQIDVGGRIIPNENNFALGTISARRAFAASCNTVYGPLAAKLPPGAFQATAAQFGIGAAWKLPVVSYSGSVPPPKDVVEAAMDGIGQGRVLVSPFAEALMAATVVAGRTPSPALVAGQPATARNPPTPPPASVLPTLRSFMRAVVTEGTATDLSGVPGGAISGKTGTAEFGAAPPKAHSWFTGFRGDLAFSVFVYGGQTGGQRANPLAASFLTQLAGG